MSVVVPVYNEVEGIQEFIERSLCPAVKKLDYRSEIILVNDGSTDGTLKILHKIAKKKAKVKVVSLSRNFGKEAALTAGLRYAKGDAVITIDADGQQPPALIPDFIEKWEKGAKIVTGVRSQYTEHGWLQKMGSKMFIKILRLLGNKTMVSGSTDYRLLDRMVVEEFNKLSEHNRITRGLIDWLGFEQQYVEYVYGTRNAGAPSYNVKKLFQLALNSFISMSTTPLIIFGYLGILITVGSFILGMFCIINQYILGDPLHLYWNGAVQLAIFITFLVGLLMISQAITALYISHIYSEVQGRPLYVVDTKESRNLE